MEILSAALTLLGGTLLACVKMLTKHWTTKQEKQQAHEKDLRDKKQTYEHDVREQNKAHEKAIHEQYQKHEQELTDKFSSIANNFKDYAASEREDRKKMMQITLDVHEKTINAVGEMKGSLESMRVALDQNTRQIDELRKEKKDVDVR